MKRTQFSLIERMGAPVEVLEKVFVDVLFDPSENIWHLVRQATPPGMQSRNRYDVCEREAHLRQVPGSKTANLSLAYLYRGSVNQCSSPGCRLPLELDRFLLALISVCDKLVEIDEALTSGEISYVQNTLLRELANTFGMLSQQRTSSTDLVDGKGWDKVQEWVDVNFKERVARTTAEFDRALGSLTVKAASALNVSCDVSALLAMDVPVSLAHVALEVWKKSAERLEAGAPVLDKAMKAVSDAASILGCQNLPASVVKDLIFMWDEEAVKLASIDARMFVVASSFWHVQSQAEADRPDTWVARALAVHPTVAVNKNLPFVLVPANLAERIRLALVTTTSSYRAIHTVIGPVDPIMFEQIAKVAAALWDPLSENVSVRSAAEVWATAEAVLFSENELV